MFKLGQTWHDVYQSSPYAVKNLMASVYAYWSGLQKYGGVYSEWKQFLDASYTWTGEQLGEYQQARLRELAGFVHQHSGWYADQMRSHGIDPLASDIVREMKKFPVINKLIVREHHAEIATSFAGNKRLVFTTSGTTGATLKVPFTAEALQREYAFRWHYLQRAAGAHRSSRFAYFTGHSVVPVNVRRPPFHIRNYAENAMMFSLYHMADGTIGSYADAFNDFSPEYMFGYPSGIYVFSNYLRKHRIRIHAPRAIFSSSEKLHDFERQQIEEVFQAPVFEWYGQVELTVNLQMCAHRRLHVMETYGQLELLKDDGAEARPGEMGSAIATGWGNKAFPLIRYDTGDNFRLSPETSCPCGRSGRIVQEVMGRDDDLVVTPEGTTVVALGWVFHALDTIREGQIVQEALDRMLVKLVPTAAYTASDGERVVARLRQRVGPSVNIRVETVPAIERSANGKFRYVISKIQPNTIAFQAQQKHQDTGRT